MKKAKFKYEGKSKKIVGGRKVKEGDILELPETFSHNQFKKLDSKEDKSIKESENKKI